jgi:nucleoside-diphosphate-sugar epimerase
MKVFVASASGTIGIPLVRSLVAAGHRVTALPKEGPSRASDLVATNRLRIDGTRLAAHVSHVWGRTLEVVFPGCLA